MLTPQSATPPRYRCFNMLPAALDLFNYLILDELHENCKYNKWTYTVVSPIYFVYDQSRLKDGLDSLFPAAFYRQGPVGTVQGNF
jgi:hypothetical protein